jgi:hypothetical protein
MILVKTNNPCLRVGCHNWYQSFMSIMSLIAIFLKIYGEDTLRCPHKDYNSLNMWQANRDLLPSFTLCNLLSVTMHL